MIEKIMRHIWIGPHPPPMEWMQTWINAHPTWRYELIDNDYVTSRRFRAQAQINAYFRRGKFAGVSDLIRYEILAESGGFIAEADSLCLHPVDELLQQPHAYTVYEHAGGATGMVSPFLACEAGNSVLQAVVQKMTRLNPAEMGMPWNTTGNGFLRQFLAKNPDMKQKTTIFPSHYFIPEHYKGASYTGPDRIYARQLWATTKRCYPHQLTMTPEKKAAAAERTAAICAKLEANLPHA
jgi:Glycosyltransferase sugar-binding region containing DXD motif